MQIATGTVQRSMLDAPVMNDIFNEEPELSPAKPAATMVIMHSDPDGGPPKLLMVERVKTMAFAGGAAVFPGGKVDKADFDFARSLGNDLTLGLDIDEVAARLAAIRETIEEAGLALGLAGVGDPADCEAARDALNSQSSTLRDVCDTQGWTPDLAKLIPWARWRPPTHERASRVYDTRFYLVDAGHAQLNAVVDATENSALFWASAQEALDYADEGRIHIIFPTRRNLERLAQFPNFSDAADHAHAHPVRTVLTYIDKRADGTFLRIPADHGYPVTEEPVASASRG